LWSTRLGRPIGPPIWHRPSARCALIDPGERWAVTAGEDATARLHPAPIEVPGTPTEVTLLGQVVTGAELSPGGDLRVLSPSEWRTRAKSSSTTK